MKKNYLILFLLSAFVCFNANAQSNQYLHLDGDDDSVILEDASQYLSGSTGHTMAGWFWFDELAYGQGIMDFRGASEDEFYMIMLNNGQMECRWIPNGVTYEILTPEFSVLPEVWQHIAFTFTGSEITVFINGEIVDTKPAAGVFDAPDVDFSIGESVITCCDFYFGGGVDEVTLWSRSLTKEEVQDMMDNELTGSEDGLELYYKFNQGVPGEDNSSITEAISEVGGSDRNAALSNLALVGPTSNFIGELDLGFQAITFPTIPNNLISGESFDLNAEASSDLPVTYVLVSGPATIDGNTVTLTGEAGEVVILASQSGDADFDAATDVSQSFQVLDPQTFVPEIEVRNPLDGQVFVPELSAIQLACISNIGYPELFNVQEVSFIIDGQIIPAKDWGNGHYTAWWIPTSDGTHNITVASMNNYEATANKTATIVVTDNVEDQQVEPVQGVVLDGSVSTATIEAELPSYLGAYDQILGTLDIKCPAGGCDPWDRVAQIEVKGHNGEWVEIIRYITPYGIACDHTIDLTDFMSLLQGKVTFRINYVTFAGGFDYNLRLDYRAGTPEYKYSNVDVLWNETFEFGDYANLQPVPTLNVQHPENAEASKLKLVSTGHGWYGNNVQNNTANAAEFYEATHDILVNGAETFSQYNWMTCSPNPDGCNNQAGSWTFPRAGWCPGAIAPWFDFEMTPYVGANPVELNYRFFEDYVDLCHPNHPDCESSTPPQCDCSDGFNPHLIVSSSLISFANEPMENVFDPVTPGINDLPLSKAFYLYPNPTKGLAHFISWGDFEEMTINILNNQGQTVYSQSETNVYKEEHFRLNLKNFANGIYVVEMITEKGKSAQKLVVK